MRKRFPIEDQIVNKDQVQNRLMIMAGMIIVLYALVLSMAPAIRKQMGFEAFQFQHWFGVLLWGLCFGLLNHQTRRHIPARDPFLLPIVALLSGLGSMTVWRLYPNFGFRQSIWITVATVIMVIGIKYPVFLDYLRKYKYIWLVSGLLLTAMTIFFGFNPNGVGPRLWLQIFGIHIQPSELLKLLLIAFLAGYFENRLTIADRKAERFLPTIFVIGIALLLLVFQRDLGTASIYLLFYIIMLFVTQGDRLILWVSPILILTVAVSGYLLVDVVSVRIDTWLSPFSDTIGAAYQINQSLIAIAEGGVIGTGLGLGSPALVPVAVSDFIFAAIAEELGFVGITIIILCFIFLIYRGAKLSIQTNVLFHRYLSLGITIYLGIQTILIIGGNIGLLPLTGVTLPFVSYGGSSMVVSFIAILILLVISHQTQDQVTPYYGSGRRTLIVSGLMICVLMLEIITTSLISFWVGSDLASRQENPRWVIDDRFRPRGEILDRNNRVIITNSGEPGTYQRSSAHIPLYPIIGYTNSIYGQTGIETSMFEYLRGNAGTTFSERFFENLLYNQPPDGLNIRLTLDLDLQQTADQLIATLLEPEIPATAVLINASSGEILAMASHPYFDASNLATIWEDLITDQNAPLVNRATQGLYPTGEILLPFVSAALSEKFQQNPDPQDLLPNIDQLEKCPIRSSDELTWNSLLTFGCIGLQNQLIRLATIETVTELYQSLGIFTSPMLHLPVTQVHLPDDIGSTILSSDDETIALSPLQLALAASTLANNGVLPGARIVTAYQAPDGSWITLPKGVSNSGVLDAATASLTAQLFQTSSAAIWQHSSVSSTENGDSVSWFIAGTTSSRQGQPVVAVVLIEAIEPETAKEIGISLLESVLFNPNTP